MTLNQHTKYFCHYNKHLRLYDCVLTACFLSMPLFIMAQSLGGHWEGTLSQRDRPLKYYYQLDIRQDGKSVSGASYSLSPDSSGYARFQVTGLWGNGQLMLQEIRQTEPEQPRWCLKYATLTLEETDTSYRLTGPWEAEDCIPGQIRLTKPKQLRERSVEEEAPFDIKGRWAGALSQSDRDYGFFFETSLRPNAAGSSYIVSEGNGGSAHHALRWNYDSTRQRLRFRESEVIEKTDARWPWCIKTATLQLRRVGSRYVLEGEWEGYIEGHEPDDPRARCASGGLLLEKPVLTRQVVRQVAVESQKYKIDQDRQIKVERVLEVQNDRLRIRVWDNGTVDGDVATLFLNGEKLLDKQLVTKRKISIPVQLRKDNNFLILHADDLGDITPNTVAVSVDDGVKEQTIILSSNLKESGAVMVRRFRIGGDKE